MGDRALLNFVQRVVRRAVPSLALLTRYPALFIPLDAVDAAMKRIFPEFRDLPPPRLRVRTGVGQRIVFNQVSYRYASTNFWTHAFGSRWLQLDSSVLELGCGAGRYATGLKDTTWLGRSGFTGPYTGIDVDEELLAWCRRRFPNNFSFVRTDAYNAVYNPTGDSSASLVVPAPGDSQEFVFSLSLFTHLLTDDLVTYLREAHRVMRPGAHLVASVFCVDHLNLLGEGLGGRWTFGRRIGQAWVEDLRYPEAAVAYEARFLLHQCEQAGFIEAQIEPGPQSFLLATK